MRPLECGIEHPSTGYCCDESIPDPAIARFPSQFFFPIPIRSRKQGLGAKSVLQFSRRDEAPTGPHCHGGLTEQELIGTKIYYHVV